MTQLGGVGASFAEGGDAKGSWYGPRIGGDPQGDHHAYVRPASKLSPRAISVPGNGSPQLLADWNPDRKSLLIVNQNGPTVYIGDDESVSPGPNAGANVGVPLLAGQELDFGDREYVGPVYAVGVPGNAAAVISVAEPY